MLHFNDLIEDVLIHLFAEHFSAYEQVQLRIICQRWKSVIESACKRRTSLKLFDDIRSLTWYTEWMISYNLQNDHYYRLCRTNEQSASMLNDELIHNDWACYWSEHVVEKRRKAKEVDPESGHFLAELFPNIRKLIVYACFATTHDSSSLNSTIEYCLSKWTGTLESLTMITRNDHTDSHNVGSSIPQCTALRRLELLSNYSTDHNSFFELRNLSDTFLYQLERIWIDSERFLNPSDAAQGQQSQDQQGQSSKVKTVVQRLGGSTRIRKLLLNSRKCIDEAIGLLSIPVDSKLTFVPPLVQNVTKLILTSYPDIVTHAQLGAICRSFRSLRSINFIADYEMKFEELISALGQSRSLQKLVIRFGVQHSHYARYRIFNKQLIPPEYTTTRPLNLITRLTLDNSKYIQDLPTFTRVIPQVFPALQALLLVEKDLKQNLIQFERNFRLFKSGSQIEECEFQQIAGHALPHELLGSHVQHVERYLADCNLETKKRKKKS